MPLYEFQCEACDARFEVIRKFSDPPVDACKVCGKGPVRRLQSSPAIQFKGSGWYITDYAKKGGSDTPSSGETDTKGADSKGGDSKGGDTKGGDAKGGDAKGANESKSEGGTKTETASKSAPTASTTSTPTTSKD